MGVLHLGFEIPTDIALVRESYPCSCGGGPRDRGLTSAKCVLCKRIGPCYRMGMDELVCADCVEDIVTRNRRVRFAKMTRPVVLPSKPLERADLIGYTEDNPEMPRYVRDAFLP